MKFVQAFIILIYDIVVFQRRLVGDRGGGLHIFAQQVIVSDHLFVIPFFLSMHLLTFSF